MLKVPNHEERVGAPVSSVSAFVLQLRELIEKNCPLGWVSGEISNLVRASSGHLYFTLKDGRAQIRCTMWRNRSQLIPFQLLEGMQIEVRAQATVYEARGDLQLSIENVRRAGLGSMFEALQRLKAQLEAEGLFATDRKRSIPPLPCGLALVTSSAGAALHDVLSSLRRRAPGLPITLYPTLVQGDGAALSIAKTINTASARAREDSCELMIVCRGGGSIEDLWAFNHEAVARAIAGSSIPVICGIGHETDSTLADHAADLRAPTPTAAAELASAAHYRLRQDLPALHSQLLRAIRQRLQQATQQADELERRLIHPRARLARSAEALRTLAERIQRAARQHYQTSHSSVRQLDLRLRARLPRSSVQRKQLQQLEHALQHTSHWHLSQHRHNLNHLAARLEALNPTAVLARGYALVRDEHGNILREAGQTSEGRLIQVQLAHSNLKARVEKPD